MYGGAHGLAVRSLLSLQAHITQKGHTVTFDIVAGGSILPKVRNGIVKRFIDSGADVLVFIDSDMVYDAETIEKLVDAPFDVSIANYRKRNNEVTYMAEPIRRDGEVIGHQVDGETWLRTERGGTGIMAIKRGVITTMVNCYPKLAYMDNGESIPCLFDFRMVGGQYMGEDYTFCQRWTGIGGKIYILANVFIGHIGDIVYGGNYHEYLIRG